MYYLIYKTTCLVNNRIYIGRHETEDFYDNYLGSGSLLKRDIKLFGRDKFTKEILFICESREEMIQKENEIVDDLFVARFDTYNVKAEKSGNIGQYKGLKYFGINLIMMKNLKTMCYQSGDHQKELLIYQNH